MSDQAYAAQGAPRCRTLNYSFSRLKGKDFCPIRP